MIEKYEEEKTKKIKVIILGSIGVGKTCLVTRYKTKNLSKILHQHQVQILLQ